MLLTHDQEMIRDAVRAFAQEQLVAATPPRWDREHHFPREAHKGLAALGAYGICVPEEYGGAGLDYLALALVLEEIAAGDGGTCTAISVNNCPVNAILMRYGNDAQKEQWLTPLAQGEMLGAFCLTEPHVGSEAVGAAHHAPCATATATCSTASSSSSPAARTATSRSSWRSPTRAAGKKGISAFLVPTDTPGYIVARLEDKIGQHCERHRADHVRRTAASRRRT